MNMSFKQFQEKISGRGYKQQKFGITYHFAWVLGLDWGIKNNFTKTDYLLRDHSKIKMFDYPYLLTMSAENGGWVRYQLLPASMHGHRVNLVDYFIEVNPAEPPLEIWSGNYHCIHCKLMGSETTMETYTCSGPYEIDWLKECGCRQCTKGIACTWTEVSEICHGK